jgi:hypothetical protein
MKRLAVAALLLAAAPAVAAQEGPPPAPPKDAPAAPASPAEEKKVERHENKISAEAKALFEKMGKLLYSAAENGLKEFSGTLRMEMTVEAAEGGDGAMAMMPPMGLEWTASFQAPRTVSVAPKGEASPFLPPDARKSMAQMARAMLHHMLGFLAPGGDDEFDAEVRSADGKTTLVVTSYEKGVKVGVTDFAISEIGLPSSFSSELTMAAGAGPMDRARQEGKFVFEKEGEKYRFLGMDMSSPQEIEMRATWSEVAGFKLVTRWSAKVKTGMGKMLCGYAFSDLTVNGKKVDLPGSGAAKPAAPGTATPGEGGIRVPTPEEIERLKKQAEELRGRTKQGEGGGDGEKEKEGGGDELPR